MSASFLMRRWQTGENHGGVTPAALLERIRAATRDLPFAPQTESLKATVSDLFMPDNPPARTLVFAAEATDGRFAGVLLGRAVFEVADLDFLGVHPAFQRQGLGRKLMLEFFRHLSLLNAERVMLEVSVQNPVAVDLYLSLGFQKLTIRRAYYPNGDDAFIMEKTLCR